MLINRIEMRHLRTLRALRDAGTLIGAAERVCLTQSALSHQIKDLEDRIGCALVLRKCRPVQFTPAGARLLKLADDVMPLIRNAAIDIDRIADGNVGRLYMSVECHSCFEWLLPTLNAYREEWPEVDLDISSGFSFQPLPALARGDLDLVITSDPVQDLDLVYEPLFQYEALLAMSPDHALAKRRRSYVDAADLRKETLVTYPIERNRLDVFKAFLDPAGVEPQNTRHCELTTMLIQLVSSGRGVACLPNWALAEYMRKNYVVTKRLGKKGLWSTLYAAVRADRNDAAYVQAFYEVARKTCFNNLEGISPVPNDNKVIKLNRASSSSKKRKSA